MKIHYPKTVHGSRWLLLFFLITTHFGVQAQDPIPFLFEGDTLWVHPTDNASTKRPWGKSDILIDVGNGATSFTHGAPNTLAIVTQLGSGDYAPYLCDTLNAYGFDDWYLPALDELEFMYQNKDFIGGFSSSSYWSSTENNAKYASSYDFSQNLVFLTGKNIRHNVRCVRRSQRFPDFEISASVYKIFPLENTGCIDISTGGSGFCSYNWSNGDTTQIISELSEGTYYLTVTDLRLSLTLIDSFTIDETTEIKFIIPINEDTLWVYPEDNGEGIKWGETDNMIVLGNGATSFENGAHNSAAIVTQLGPGNYAAYLCKTLNAYGYDDWYLPALDELDSIYQNKDKITDFSLYWYWSSTEYDKDKAYKLMNGSRMSHSKESSTGYDIFRCVRSNQAFDNLTIESNTYKLYPDTISGVIELLVAGGSGFFSYNWSNGDSSQTLTALSPDKYIVTVTDDYTGLFLVDSFVIDESCEIKNIVPYEDDTLWVHTIDNSSGIAWGGQGVDITLGNGAESNGKGAHNTGAIVMQLGAGNYAAYLCDTLEAHGYNDWYLPAIGELQAIYNKRNELGGFSSDKKYWSSTEQGANYARNLDFQHNVTGSSLKHTETKNVRCIRRRNNFDALSIHTDTIIRTVLPATNQGEIQLQVLGGSGIYEYLWSNDSNTLKLSDLEAGNYVVTITDLYTAEMVSDSFLLKELLPIAIPHEICSGDTFSFKSLIFTTEDDYNLFIEGGPESPDTLYEISLAYIQPYEEPICVVTIDLETGKNLVVWHRSTGKQTESYNVYRETSIAEVFVNIGNVLFDSVSLFVDETSNPEQQQYLYKLTTIDVCGQESDLASSPIHKTMLLQYAGSTGGINLSWHNRYEVDGSPMNFSSYIIYRGADSFALAPIDTVYGSLFAYIDNDPIALIQDMFYRIAGERSVVCAPADMFKASTGPFIQSISNIEDNRLRDEDVSINVVTGSITNLNAYPNPFEKVLQIEYTISRTEEVHLSLYTGEGKKIAIIDSGIRSEGTHRLNYEVTNSGMYILQLQAGENVIHKKVVGL